MDQDLCINIQYNEKLKYMYFYDYINYNISLEQNVMQPPVITFI